MGNPRFVSPPGGLQMTSSSTLWNSSALAANGSFQERLCILTRKSILSVFAVLLLVSSAALAQTLTPLKHQPPDGVIYALLLTDGTVMAQGGSCSDWWKLTPDNTGSYVNGTWTQLASLPNGYAPYATASAVLADGRFFLKAASTPTAAPTSLSPTREPFTIPWLTPGPPLRLRRT